MMKVQMMQVLKDHYGQELNIGDMVLGAKGGDRYRETKFIHAIVVGRTKQMVRLHQISETGDKQMALDSLKHRGTKLGGKVFPIELIRLEQNFLTRDEIDKHHDVSLDPNGVVLPKAVQMQRPSNVLKQNLTSPFNP
jgi:hypothetical protein